MAEQMKRRGFLGMLASLIPVSKVLLTIPKPKPKGPSPDLSGAAACRRTVADPVELVHIPVSEIDFHAHDSFVRHPVMEHVHRLAVDMEERGMCMPIYVRKMASGKYGVINGTHRAWAARSLKWPTVLAYVTHTTDAEALALFINLNSQRSVKC